MRSPGLRDRPLSDVSLSAVVRRMGHGELTVHGFRSAFRDFCAEATEYPRELAATRVKCGVDDQVRCHIGSKDFRKRTANRQGC